MPDRVTRSFSVVAVLVACWLLSPGAIAAITEALDYQGYLTNSSGVPLNGAHTIQVRLYAQASGGTQLWSQSSSVTVADGRFAMLLDGRSAAQGGTGNLFPATLFDQPVWAGITVGSDPEMLPRTLLTAAPFSFKSSDADTVGGLSAAELMGPAPTTVVYLGASTSSIGGAQGHLAMSAACHATYPGSRMCTSAELLNQEGPLVITKAQHVHPVIMGSLGSTEVIDYSGNKTTWSLMMCGSVNGRAWSSSGSTATGLGITPATANRLTLLDCGDSQTAAAACCREE